MASLPLGFLSVLGGGLLLDKGVTAIKSGGSTSSSTGSAASTPTGSSGTVDRSLLEQIGAEHGWTGSEIDAWESIIGAEDASGSLTAKNPSSSAYGIAQFIDGPSEYATYGGNTTTAAGELTAMANYIAQRYGTPTAAWSFHVANGYY